MENEKVFSVAADEEEKETEKATPSKEVDNVEPDAGSDSSRTPLTAPIKIYLRKIKDFPVLKSKEDETILAKAIIAGKYASKRLEELKSSEAKESVDSKELERLEETAREGREAKETLFQCNLKLVVSIAKHYGGLGMGILDLIQAGNKGLKKAVNRFDYTRGIRFSEFSTWWIKRAIVLALTGQEPAVDKVSKAQTELAETLGREPTPEEISETLNGEVKPRLVRMILVRLESEKDANN